MEIEKLDQGVKIQVDITKLISLIDNAKKQECGWIQFTFGNGSNRLAVCDDPDIIENIRQSIIKANEAKLSRLKQQFKEL